MDYCGSTTELFLTINATKRYKGNEHIVSYFMLLSPFLFRLLLIYFLFFSIHVKEVWSLHQRSFDITFNSA
jgi:hypothetical protein